MVRTAASLALLAVLASSTTACAMSRESRTTLIVAGATAAVVGGVMVRMDPTPVDADHNGINGTTLDDDYSTNVLGALIMLGGMAFVLGGIAAHEPADSDLSASWSERHLAVAPTAIEGAGVPSAGVARLPELATTADVVRLAQQARAAAGRGNCDAAWTTVVAIQGRDLSYGNAVAEGPVMAGCRGSL